MQRDDSASMRWELEAKCSQVGTLEERLRVVQAALDTRSRALSDAEAALERTRAEVQALQGRLAAAAGEGGPHAGLAHVAAQDDAEVAGLQAEITRLNAALHERRSGSGGAAGGGGGDGASDLELLQLRCTLEAKQRELADVRRELAEARAAAASRPAAGDVEGEHGLAHILQEQLQGVVEQRRAAERRVAESEGARILLDAECAALRADVKRLQQAGDGPPQVGDRSVRCACSATRCLCRPVPAAVPIDAAPGVLGNRPACTIALVQLGGGSDDGRCFRVGASGGFAARHTGQRLASADDKGGTWRHRWRGSHRADGGLQHVRTLLAHRGRWRRGLASAPVCWPGGCGGGGTAARGTGKCTAAACRPRAVFRRGHTGSAAAGVHWPLMNGIACAGVSICVWS